MRALPWSARNGRAHFQRMQHLLRSLGLFTHLHPKWQLQTTLGNWFGQVLPRAVDMILLFLWHIWKTRNALIFDHQDLSPVDVIHKILKDIDAWSCRYKSCELMCLARVGTPMCLLTSPLLLASHHQCNLSSSVCRENACTKPTSFNE